MLADTHCHLDFQEFENDRKIVIENALNEGVGFIINPAIDLVSCLKAIEITRNFECVYATVGIHPHNAEGYSEEVFDSLTKLVSERKIVGIGETGLDFFYNKSSRQKQIEVFKKHIEIAKKYDLPLIVHQRQAQDETMEIFGSTKCPTKVVFHCFSGDEKFLEWAISKGFYISFTGILTFKNAIELKKIAEKVPLNRVFFETDAPYLAPVPFRGKRNEPRFVRFIVEAFAGIRKMSVKEIAHLTTENAIKFFGIESIKK